MKTQRFLHLEGATCPSCAYTIEKVGRKLEGVEDVHVNSAMSRVDVDFGVDGSVVQDVTLDRLVHVVRQIGYDASIIPAESD